MAILKIRDADGNVTEIPAIQGADGKSAYEYAQDGGYTGTEEEFAQLMANGSGGLVGTELTQAEYDALTEEEKNNGLYFITDGVYVGDSNGIAFSQYEVKTSDTFLGKPIYTKTIMFNTTVKDEMIEIAHNINDIDYIWVDMQNTFMLASSGLSYPLVTLRYNKNTVSVQVSATKTSVRLDVAGGWGTIWTKVITVRYTKTTD